MNDIAIANGTTANMVKEIIERFIGSLDVKPKSKETYRKAVNRFVEWLSSKGISQAKREDILRYKNELMTKHTACTVSSYITAVKSLYTYLEGEKICPNIAAGIKGAKHQKGFRKDCLSASQAANVISGIDTGTIEGKRNYALVNLLIRTGLRTVEAERANIEDIRNETGEALLYIQGKGRDEKDAFVVLTESALKPIREYLKARGKAKDTDPLFVSHSNRNWGKRLSTNSISQICKKALVDAGYDDSRLTAHSMRHTAITLSLLAGASIQEAQSLARHSNINTTLIYAHNIQRIAQAPERKIDALLANAG
jgi:integrase/recombinase XerC/integrase/recombinase XerD